MLFLKENTVGQSDKQLNADVENKVPDGEIGENGRRNLVIKYCRACELSCPVGA